MFDIRIDGGQLKTAKSGAVWGAIWLDTDVGAVPQVGWQDLVAGVLEHWGQQLVSLRADPAAVVDFRFFDGPYGFTCQRDERILTITFWSRGPWRPPAQSIQITLKEFCDSYLIGCRDLISAMNCVPSLEVQVGKFNKLMEEVRSGALK